MGTCLCTYKKLIIYSLQSSGKADFITWLGLDDILITSFYANQ